MDDPRAQRTLVKSLPELWAQVSDGEVLAAHLAAFGEIRITRLEPETTVAWEGDRACGTVALEPAGWGTRVTLTARVETDAARGPDAEPAAEAQPPPRRRWWWPFGPRRGEAPAAAPPPEPGRAPTEDEADAGRAAAVLAGVLDDLGAARHRPFSRG